MGKQDTTKDVKLVTPKMDEKDFMFLANIYLNTNRCCGGRLIMAGLVCTHCDSNDPSSYCEWAKIGTP